MARGVNIPIAADATGVISEGKKVEGALEKVIGSLDDIGDASKDSAKVTEGSLEGIATEGQSSADKLERSFRESFEKVEKQSKTSGDSIGRGVKEGTDGASAGLEDFKSEADGTAREVAASFDGSAESIAGGFQEVAANAFAGFGPAGAVAGLAAAAGIGLVTKRMEEAKAKAQEAAEEIAQIAGELIDLKSADLGAEQVNDALKEMATTAEDGTVELDKVGKQAKDAGIDFKNYARGLAGDNEAIHASYDEIVDAIEAQSVAHDNLVARYGLGSAQVAAFNETAYAQADALAAAKKALEEKDGSLRAAGDTAGLYQAAEEAVTGAVERSTEALDASKAALQDHIDKLDAANDSARGLWDAETQVASAVADATAVIQENKDAGLDPATEAGRANRDALSEVAGAYDTAADSILAAGGTQAEANAKTLEGRDAVKKLAAELGITEAQADTYADQLGLIPPKIDTQLALQMQHEAYEDARSKYDGLGRPITPEVKPTLDTADLDNQIRNYRAPRIIVTGEFEVVNGYRVV